MKTEAPIVRANLRVEAPGRALLATDLYLPRDGRPAPAVLLRTYVGKGRHFAEGIAWARQGFACVVQDVRGRYDSEGTWEPYVHEREDGAATVAWAAGQSWSDGRVAAIGGSYAAFTAWAAALSHPAVRAAVVSVPAMHRVNFEPGGVLKLMNHTAWWTTHGDGRTERPSLFAAMHRACPRLLDRLPVIHLPSAFWADLPGWLPALLAGPDSSPPITDREIGDAALPVLHIGGWHDPFVGETVRQWNLAGSALRLRPRQGLLIGPWTHDLRAAEPAVYGERDYGSASRLPLGQAQVLWLRSLLGAAPAPPAPREPAVRIFLTGANRWLESESWPPVPVAPRSWFAAAGRTLAAEPGREGSDTFAYDPLDPFPARTAPVDQSDLARRSDAVSYTSPPLAAPLTYFGAPEVILWAATDGPGTDWVARLHEILASGRSLYLGHGLVDAAREMARGGDELAPGEPHRVTIRLPPLAIAIPAGHRLRLEITSSYFPEHARNLNTGADRLTTARTRVARQTLFWGSATPTALVLPVAEGLP